MGTCAEAVSVSNNMAIGETTCIFMKLCFLVPFDADDINYLTYVCDLFEMESLAKSSFAQPGDGQRFCGIVVDRTGFLAD